MCSPCWQSGMRCEDRVIKNEKWKEEIFFYLKENRWIKAVKSTQCFALVPYWQIFTHSNAAILSGVFLCFRLITQRL